MSKKGRTDRSCCRSCLCPERLTQVQLGQKYHMRRTGEWCGCGVWCMWGMLSYGVGFHSTGEAEWARDLSYPLTIGICKKMNGAAKGKSFRSNGFTSSANPIHLYKNTFMKQTIYVHK